jgi:hypothetical protein
MGASLKITGKGRLARKLDRMRHAVFGKSVVAGYIEGLSHPDDIYKAYKNEYGFISSDLRRPVPPRPFMHRSVPIMIEHLAPMVKNFNIDEVDACMEEYGVVMAEAIHESIDAGKFAANTQYTLKRKSGTKPLVDTGEMKEGATYQVRQEEVPF